MSAQEGAEPVSSAEGRRRWLVAMLNEGGLEVGSGDEAGDGSAHRDSGSSPSPRGLSGLRGRLRRLCVITVVEVGVDGAGVTMMSSADAALAGYRDQLAATGPLTRRLEDLQLTMGEGPCVEAYTSGAPVLAGDVATETTRWLGFAPEAIAAGAAAVFSLPLQVGAVRLGTLDLNRGTAGGLSRVQLADALMLAGLATEMLLELAASLDRGDDPGDDPDADQDPGMGAGWLPVVHAEVHVASGMVSARHGIDVGVALLRIRAYAFARSEPIHDVARRLIDHDLVFDDPETHDTDTLDEGPLGPDAPLESDD